MPRPIAAPAAFAPRLPIARLARQNTAYRRVVYTDAHSQLAVMRLEAGHAIAWEVHPRTTQVMTVVEGTLTVTTAAAQPTLPHAHPAAHATRAGPGMSVVVPAGTWHHVRASRARDARVAVWYMGTRLHAPDEVLTTSSGTSTGTSSSSSSSSDEESN